jgi:hypothetical protein
MEKDLQTISTEEFQNIKKEMYQQDYFFSSSLQVIYKHFLGYFPGFEDVFSMPFEDIRRQFIISSGESEGKVPGLENSFFQFIGYEYFFLDKAPFQCLLDLYKTASRHINEIRENVTYCEQEKKNLEKEKENLQKQGEPVDEQINYKSRMLSHYIELNKIAEQQITEFVFSERIYDVAYLRSQRDPFGIKYRPSYGFEYNSKAYDAKSLSDVTNKFLKLEIKKYIEAGCLYEQHREDFHKFMCEYIATYKVVDDVIFSINKSHYLNRRSYILIPALEQYRKRNKAIFLHIVPLQIEGIFYDYCTALGIPEGKIYTSSISEKLDRIIKLNKGFYSFEYFKFRFPIIRNKIAHGKVIEAQEIDFFADFMLLDLLDVSNRIISDEFPLNKILSSIQQAYDLNDKSSLTILAFALSKNFDIPEFYQVEGKIDELKLRFFKDEFLKHLLELAGLDNRIINGGIHSIVSNLKRMDKSKEPKYVEIFKKIGGNCNNEFDLAKFIDEIESSGSQIA